LTITSAEGPITKIVFTFTNSDSKKGGMTTTVGTYSSGTWEGSANEVVFTTSEKLEVTDITVTYTAWDYCTTPTFSSPTNNQTFRATDNTEYTATAVISADEGTEAKGSVVEYAISATEVEDVSTLEWSEALNFTPSTYAENEEFFVYARTKADTEKGYLASAAVYVQCYVASSFDNIKALRTKVESDGTETKRYYVNLDNAVVTIGDYADYFYVEQDADGKAYGMIFYETVASSSQSRYKQAGATFSGETLVQAVMMNGEPIVTLLNKDDYTLTDPAGGSEAPKATEVTLGELASNFADYDARYVKVRRATVSSVDTENETATVTQGDASYTLRYRASETMPSSLAEGNTIIFKGAPVKTGNNGETSYEIRVYAVNKITALTDFPQTFTISKVGYKTLYYGANNLILPAGLTAYAVTEFDEGNKVLKMQALNSDNTTSYVLPAGTGVVVEGTANETYSLEATDDDDLSATAVSNMLEGTDAEETVTASDNNYLYYFGYEKSTLEVGFYMCSGDGQSMTNPAYSVYLELPYDSRGESSAKGVTLDFGNGNVTSIDSLNAETPSTNGDIYTLQGTKVNAQALAKGIYIQNGRKFVVK